MQFRKRRRLGDVIRTSRESIGLSQRELGRRIRITASHVAYIEAGRRRPSHSLLFRLARSLNLNLRQLFLFAYPEIAPLIANHPPTESREVAWRNFVAVADRYSVTPGELAVLRKISRLAKISSPNKYFWILNSIRQSLEED
ncbi:MAG: helix-turn-helix domain-containing protein [Candidatus Binatus sp.]